MCNIMAAFFLFYFVFGLGLSNAATYYASTTGSGTTCSSGLPCTLSGGIGKMASGDTLILKDGSYNVVISGEPNGSSGGYTVIKAENDGGVVITQPFTLTHTNSYIQFEGLKFDHASGKSIVGNHLKFLRCAFVGGMATNNEVNVGIGTNNFADTQYILLEDCWAYGSGGRYKIMVYNSDKVVLRRVVVRDDGGWTSGNGDPEAGIVIYQSSNVSVQNAIVIDSDLSTYDNDNVGAFYLTGHAGNRPSSNAEYLGCMAINNKKWGWNVDTDDLAVGLTMRDIVIYGQEIGGIAQSNTSVAIDLQRMILGNTGYGIGNWNTSGKVSTLSNFLFLALTGTASTGTNTLTNYSTFATNATAKSAGLSYLTRIESPSTLATSGQGPSILYQIGISGTQWGDTGYNTTTGTALWPWQNEARIKLDMAAVSARGFATGTSRNGTPQTLTKYIWEYLGNTIPAGIYPTTPPPAAPKNFRIM